MAMIDYGALLKINGKIVNRNEFFMDMQEAVGWVDYPRIRYEDCDCVDEENCSDCGDCPRRQTKRMSDKELGEWDVTTGDCRGNKIWIDDKIDRNYFAYAGDEDFTVAVYKNWAVFTNKEKTLNKNLWSTILDNEFDARRMVRTFSIQIEDETVLVKARKITESNSQIYMIFRYKGNLYEIVYGYGIDSNQERWNKIKSRYVDKKTMKFVDKFWKEK